MKIFINSLVELVGGEHQRRLLQHLFEESKYNQLERPVLNDSNTLHVVMNLALQQIIDFVSQNEKLSPIRSDFFPVEIGRKK